MTPGGARSSRGLGWLRLGAITAGVGGALAVAALASPPSSGDPGEAHAAVLEGEAPSTFSQRPFLHRDHQGLSCMECHGIGEEHGVIAVETARDCAACHHDPERGYSCDACHAEADLPPPAGVASTMSLTVWDEPRVRDLPFDHSTHAQVSCGTCHTEPVTLAVELECSACHAEHHEPDSDCTACHVPVEEGAHGLEVHLTCATAGCHGREEGRRPELTRSLCLMCHTDQVDHEPGLTCHECHMVPHEEIPRPRGEEER